jgi:hypothetical protein
VGVAQEPAGVGGLLMIEMFAFMLVLGAGYLHLEARGPAID